MLEQILHFKGTWRSYQQRVLDKYDRYSQDRKIHIVAAPGSGKTTLISLLLRFYDVTSGSICIDGVDIRQIPREQLRSMFGMVLQDTWLFHGSIYENIHYGRLDARKDEVIEAARQANVDHFIRTLPDGYDMIVNEEANNIFTRVKSNY